jgi:hypothetical protein
MEEETLTTITSHNIIHAAEQRSPNRYVRLDFEQPLTVISAIVDACGGDVAFILKDIDGKEVMARFSEIDSASMQELYINNA